MAKISCPVCNRTKFVTNTRGFFVCIGDKQNPHDQIEVARNPTAKRERLKGTEFKFVNCSLTEGEMKDAKAWLQTDFDISTAIVELLGQGYKFSLSCNLDTETYQCTLSAGYAGMENAGYMLSAFAPTWEFAFGICYYKHAFKLERDWTSNVAANVGAPKWG